MDGHARWYERFEAAYHALQQRGLYVQAAAMWNHVLAASTITEAVTIIAQYESLLTMWRDDVWLTEAGRIAVELHAHGYAAEAQTMMQLISGAFSQADAEHILADYVRLLTSVRRDVA